MQSMQRVRLRADQKKQNLRRTRVGVPTKFLYVPALRRLPESRNPATAAIPSVDSALERLGVGAQHRTERRRDTLEQLWVDESADLSRLKMRVWACFSFLRRTSPEPDTTSME